MEIKRIKIVLISLSLCIFILPIAAYAQRASGEAKAIIEEDLKMQKEMKKMQEQMEKEQLQMLAELKKIDPEQYKKQKAEYDRQKKVTRVLEAYHEKKITESSAERQLYPLVKEEVAGELLYMDERIKKAQEYLHQQQEYKRRPETLIRKRIDQMLGRVNPEDSMDILLP